MESWILPPCSNAGVYVLEAPSDWPFINAFMHDMVHSANGRIGESV